jgi:AraC family transcriptional regulator
MRLSLKRFKRPIATKTPILKFAVPISGSVEITGNEEIREYELHGGKMARIVHKGPYEECSPTYKKLFSLIAEKGKRIVGPIREIYFNDPREVTSDEILAKIYAPLD